MATVSMPLGSEIRTETPSSAGGSPVFNLRARRDLLSRRLWSELGGRGLRAVVLLGIDALSVMLGLAIASNLTIREVVVESNMSTGLPIVLLLTVFAQAAVGSYGHASYRRIAGRSVLGVGLSTVAAWIVARASSTMPLSLMGYVLFFGTTLPLIVLGRCAFESGMRVAHRSGYCKKNTLVIGSRHDIGEAIEYFRKAKEHGIHIVGYLCPTPGADSEALGGLEQLGNVIEEFDVRNVIVMTPLALNALREVTARCFQHGVRVGMFPGAWVEPETELSCRDIAGWPLLELRVPRLYLLELFLKRCIDLFLSLIGIVCLLPVYIILAVAIKLDSPGPILFRQARLGVGGQPFTIYKFRSMRSDAEAVLRSDPDLYKRYIANNYKLPEGEDPRISRIGRFLRKTSLDELPQLFNVLRGDMSLVGPRPIVVDELVEYGDRASDFLGVKPGITGYWQISGRSAIGYPERVDLDMYYVHNWSLLLDLKILCLTVPRVIQGNGAH